MAGTITTYLSGSRARRFRAVQQAAVPRSKTFDRTARERSFAIIEQLLDRQTAATRRQIGTFLILVDGLSLLRFGRRIHRLRPRQLEALLARLADSRIALMRRGVDGIATLVKASVYGQSELRAQLGYRPPDGVDG